jgi:hypothetical protein
MSIEAFGDPASPLLAFGDTLAEDCFWCGKPLVDPVVYWHGHYGGLALHPSCAEKLGLRLTYDARRATAIAEGKSLFAGIDRRWHAAARDEP